MKKKFSISAVFILQLLFFSCANQIPPSGGVDDKIPPKIIYVFPEPGRLNFKGDAVTFRFDEYVDRRSFEESFYISPKPKGEINFEWSGKEVEVRFEGKFANDRTYVITVGKELKDVRGSNSTGSSYSIAFSTGGKLDKGKISGRVYADKYDRIKILAYIRNVKTGTEINPAIQTADYITQTDDNGYYIFTNLPSEEFELFAVTDEDRNNLFSKDFESISILKSSIKIQDDSALYSDANFLFRNPVMNRSGIDFLKELEADTSGYIFSNIFGKDEVIPCDYRFYFYFKNNQYTKPEIINNFSITDSVKGKVYKTIFNWINDSLLEVFSNEKFSYSSELQIRINLTGRMKILNYFKKLKTAAKNSSGIVSGKILKEDIHDFPVYIFLINKDNKFISYSRKLSDSADFRFDEVYEGAYIVFSFADENDNGVYDRGSVEPFLRPEVFRIYDKEIKVKSGWNTDNIFIEY